MLMISRDRLQNLECMSCGCPVSPMRTSSFDPAPTTDRNVSTSQQQPLPSPNPDVADDTFVTPPGTTAYPAGYRSSNNSFSSISRSLKDNSINVLKC
ncbi:uncharacterized protein LOC105636227 [Jatropha curcas]|uniref:uncharacterized protein LOC105636227 n=1 Tax=Jatropha curcas TaxID=180498 RepID=UPI0018945340|nr:uncharacterized protein LOC105636227 [Jatropha curcas]